MSSPTPGPWHAVKTPKDGWFILDRDDRLGHNVLYGLPDTQLEANARLLAAAPELLQLVREARELLADQDSPLDIRDWLKAADAVLAKAAPE